MGVVGIVLGIALVFFLFCLLVVLMGLRQDAWDDEADLVRPARPLRLSGVPPRPGEVAVPRVQTRNGGVGVGGDDAAADRRPDSRYYGDNLFI